MWETTTNGIPGGYEYQVLEGGSVLSFQQLIERLQSSSDFADWYTETLGTFQTDAFYWELPPLTQSILDDDARFALIDAPMLARLPAEPAPFAAHFDHHPDAGIVVFPNLGRDAILVVPAPRGPLDTYSHFAAFLRKADQTQVRSLWRVTADTVLEHVAEKPVWVSTAGGGVYWLHLRLDSRPKYYQYRPYAEHEIASLRSQ